MNSLSWLLYLAGVSENVGFLLGFLGLFVIGAGGFCTMGYFMTERSSYSRYNDDYAKELKAREDALLKRLGWSSVCGLVIGILMWVVAALIPSKETVYAIAASEMGEELLKTPTAAKATKALDAWLDKQIAENIKQAAPDQ